MTRGWYVQPETLRLPIKTGCGRALWDLDCTNSWSSAPELLDYLTKDLGFQSYSIDEVNPSIEDDDPPRIPVGFLVQPGDVVFYKAWNKPDFNHAALVTGWGPQSYFRGYLDPPQCSTNLPLDLARFSRGDDDWLPWIVDRQGAGYQRAFNDTLDANKVVFVHIPRFLGEW